MLIKNGDRILYDKYNNILQIDLPTIYKKYYYLYKPDPDDHDYEYIEALSIYLFEKHFIKDF